MLVLTPDGGASTELPLCGPPDQIEGKPGCPIPPFLLERPDLPVAVGRWTAVAHLIRGADIEATVPVTFRVLAPTLTSAGAVVISEVTPNEGAPAIRFRDASPAFPDEVTTPGEVDIIGENLHTNPFLKLYLAPRPFGEPDVAVGEPLHISDWCLIEAPDFDASALAGGGSKLTVKLPEVPVQMHTTCGSTPQQLSSPFQKEWRWVVRDPWIRPERIHEWWAIPSPRPGPGHDAPPFRLIKPAYPKIDGFSFANHKTDATYKEFTAVFGNNAYICLGAFGLCATRVPDPFYHMVWWPLYKLIVNETGGSCAGMSSTSLLMARGDLEPEAFEPDVHFPIGLLDPGDPTYEGTSVCSPACGPYKPSNLWATIRMNHGVQISREFLKEVLETLGEAVFDPDNITSIKGIPEATLQRVAADPQGYVLCFFKVGKGHCVTPYRVEGNRIWIYDNNEPKRVDKSYIDIVGGDYEYPHRDGDPNHGNAIVAFPIDIWKNGRNLLGVGDFSEINGVKFLQMFSFGDADLLVTNGAGGRWGWEDDGTFTDALFGAASIAPLGPSPGDVRQMPLLLAMNQPAPTVQINARGGHYYFHTSEGRLSLQIEATDAAAGDKDGVRIGYAGGNLASAAFTPAKRANHVVFRGALAIGDQERALFHWLGLDVPGLRTVQFGADLATRSATYRNDTGTTSQHLLMLDYVAGPAEAFGRVLYGPFEVPQGATHRVVLAGWPEVTQVRSEVDTDGDGVFDRSSVVTGRPLVTPTDFDASADLSIQKTVSPTELTPGDDVTYSITVRNNGSMSATAVRLEDVLPSPAIAVAPVTSQGACTSAVARLTCELGTLAPGETAIVRYSVSVGMPGAFVNGATISANEWDPDLTNNSAMAVADVAALIDIRPGSATNPINLRTDGVIPVAILGEARFSAGEIDAASLRFGPAGVPSRLAGTSSQDVNRDGVLDLVTHFDVSRSGLTPRDTTACVRGVTLSGREFKGCDVVRVVRR